MHPLSLVSFVFPMSTVSPLSLVSLVSSFPFNKHEIFSGVALFFIWCKNLDGFHCFHMWVVFGTHRRSKDVIFYKNKILPDLFRK